ncbi:MAG: hypothetical protein RBG13Loki_1949 [Promethearchaeota archaeon CR_4]|nr:MAG: hypothetical protein RBG13Loki_1949 [Candidatus Lokiarchaeota archaeon CR_4]
MKMFFSLTTLLVAVLVFPLTGTPHGKMNRALHVQPLKIEMTRFPRVTDENSNWRNELHN